MQLQKLWEFETRIGDLVECRPYPDYEQQIYEICKTIPDESTFNNSYTTAYQFAEGKRYEEVTARQGVDDSCVPQWRLFRRFDERTVEEKLEFYHYHLRQYDTFYDIEQDPTGLFHLLQGDTSAVKGSLPYEGFMTTLHEAMMALEEMNYRMESLEK
ncbi:hypothetical protein KNU84_gp005 [Bacteriophage DSS3_VP1]|uniref:Uncharacterized protein n=1 Tax=Bacteriophage DSS3_VP1 TaxID=2664196 RepID=A0A7S5FQ79_9CAUD|nr:hypothetical protein KNU84_gp005 [Bacteriophage DSS3_VP1]QGH74574.1 hypothetical protein DSS3VP1_00005 [Bacteriophage DSS3_VP1]